MVFQEMTLSVALNARVVGPDTGLTLVLAHGYGSDQTVWTDVLPELSSRYRVLLFDWSFSGAVTAPVKPATTFEDLADELLALADEWGLRGAVLIGHSLSGIVSCIATIRRPDIFCQLVLIGASPRYINDPTDGYTGGFEQPAIESLLHSIETCFPQWSEKFPSLVVDKRCPDAIKLFRESLQRMRPEVALALAHNVFLSDMRWVLPKVKIPCNVVQASDDPIVPRAAAEYMRERIPGCSGGEASMVVVQCEGHFPQLTAPEALATAVLQAVAKD